MSQDWRSVMSMVFVAEAFTASFSPPGTMRSMSLPPAPVSNVLTAGEQKASQE